MKLYRPVAALAVAFSLLAGCAANPPSGGEPGGDPAQSRAPGAAVSAAPVGDETAITLSDQGVLVDGAAISDDAGEAMYAAHDIIYYEDRDTYDSGNPYGEGTAAERHSAAEAEGHTVVHITRSGTYRVSGALSRGQIAVDLGEDARRDPAAVVTLILDGAELTCTVAPAIIFYRVYECDAQWVACDEGEREDYGASPNQDTSAAGANVVLADGSVNRVNGSYVARIYKDNGQQKKLHKYDGALYSKMSMNVAGGPEGTGELWLTAENEGLDSELHLTINGGRIYIQAQNDGINTNEDDVSVTTVNGGALRIAAGLGEEGDGIDSNGYLVINGGTVVAAANPASDCGLDSDRGIFINGGTVLALGSTMDRPAEGSGQVCMVLSFRQARSWDEAAVVTGEDGGVLFAYDPAANPLTAAYSYARGYQGMVLSCPGLAVGQRCGVSMGGTLTGGGDGGLYDPAAVTGYAGGTVQQYTSTEIGMGGPGGFGGGQRPGDFGGEPPEGFGGGQPPEGFEGRQPPEGPGGQRGPEGQMPGDRPGGPGGDFRPGGETGEGSVEFLLTGQVNNFGGVGEQ